MSRHFNAANIILVLPCIAVLIGMKYLRSAWAAILLYHAVILIYLIITRRSGPRPGLLKGWNTPVGALLILVCAMCGPLLVLLWPMIGNAQGGMAPTLEAFGLHGASWWLFAVYYVTLHPVLEELFWRGVAAPDTGNIDIVDAAFAAYHVLVLVHFLKMPWVIIIFVILVLVSWLWRRIADRYEGLAVPVLSHITAGAGIMTATWLLMSR
jgi:membrane protease YdiL (CAAX protease family)